MTKATFVPLAGYQRYPPDEMMERAKSIFAEMQRRRTVRDFSEERVPLEIIKHCLSVAGTAPSGANLQPWHFVVITDADLKRAIRNAAENEERDFYERRAPQEWLDVLAPLGTGPDKPYLEEAPYLIAIFTQSYGVLPDGRKVKHYYATESVGIACGLLITALHHVGLATLTHTPSPMKFLNKLLDRPSNERPFLLLTVGYPSLDAQVPDIQRKDLSLIASFR
ncbi:MAG: nitroreductase family protein [Candidatus Promineifilaceae bacterium]